MFPPFSLENDPRDDFVEEMQAVPSAMSAVSTIRLLRANTNSGTAQPPLPPETRHDVKL
jgi:hypothetical protein